jgi:hypothetical protein
VQEKTLKNGVKRTLGMLYETTVEYIYRKIKAAKNRKLTAED